jgi:hypothetical protein
MTQLSVHTGSLNERAEDPIVGWLHPSALVIGGVLAAALIAARFAGPVPGAETVAPSVGAIIGASAPEVMPVAATVPQTTERPSFAFGFLEFDWDPNATDGVPGFDAWPKHNLRVADASTRE